MYRALAKFVVLPWLGIAMCILNITSALGAALLYPASSFNERGRVEEMTHSWVIRGGRGPRKPYMGK